MILKSYFQTIRKGPNGPYLGVATSRRWGGVELDLIGTECKFDDQALDEVAALFQSLSPLLLPQRRTFDRGYIQLGSVVVSHRRLPKAQERDAADQLWEIGQRCLARSFPTIFF